MGYIKKILAYAYFSISLLSLIILLALNIWMIFAKRTTSTIYEEYKYTVTDRNFVLLDTTKIFFPELSLILESNDESKKPVPGISFFTDNFNIIVVNLTDAWDIAFADEYYRKYLFSSIYRDILPIYTIYKYKDDNIYIEYAGGDDSGRQEGVSFFTDVYIPGRNIYMSILGTEYDFEDIENYVAKVIYDTGPSEFDIDEEKIWQLKN